MGCGASSQAVLDGRQAALARGDDPPRNGRKEEVVAAEEGIRTTDSGATVTQGSSAPPVPQAAAAAEVAAVSNEDTWGGGDGRTAAAGGDVPMAPGSGAAFAGSSPSLLAPQAPPATTQGAATAAVPASLDSKEGAGAGAAALRPVHHVSRAAVSLAFLQDFAAQHRLAERKVTSGQLVFEIIKPATTARACRYTDLMLSSGDDDDSSAGDTVVLGPAAKEDGGNSESSPEHFGSSEAAPKLADDSKGASPEAVVTDAAARSAARVVRGKRSGSNAVSQGRPFYFVSHAWGRVFTDTLGMVARHFEPEQQRVWRRGADGGELQPLAAEEVFLWFDMFAINQHQVAVEGDSDLAALWEAVADAEETLMVLDAEGTPLTRIWCLYEAWQSGRAGAGKLRLLSYNLELAALEQVFVRLDVNRAQATVASDRDRILGDIRRDVGSLEAMTHSLKDALVRGSVAQAPSADAPWTTEGALRLCYAAKLADMYGRYTTAEPLLRRALEGAERTLGPDHTSTLVIADNLAATLYQQQRLEEAEGLYRRVLAGHEAHLGPDHRVTLKAIQNLAVLLNAAKRGDEAEPLFREAIQRKERVFGPDHPETLTALHSFATLLYGREDMEQAEPILRRVLAGRERALGANDPRTINTINNLAAVLRRRKGMAAQEEAEALYRRALAACELVLGPDHPMTHNVCGNLAALLAEGDWDGPEGKGRGIDVNRSRLDETQVLLSRAVEGARVAARQGAPLDLPDLERLIRGLVRVLRMQGREEEATALLERERETLQQQQGKSRDAKQGGDAG